VRKIIFFYFFGNFSVKSLLKKLSQPETLLRWWSAFDEWQQKLNLTNHYKLPTGNKKYYLKKNI